jgi:hypothetical protein
MPRKMKPTSDFFLRVKLVALTFYVVISRRNCVELGLIVCSSEVTTDTRACAQYYHQRHRMKST